MIEEQSTNEETEIDKPDENVKVTEPILLAFERDEKLLTAESKRKIIDTAILFAYFCALISGVGLVLLLAHMDKRVSWIIFALGFVVYIGVVGGKFLYERKKLIVALAGNKREISLTLGEKISLKDGDVIKEYEYNDFFKIYKSDGYAFLYLDKYEFITLPLEAENSEAALKRVNEKSGKVKA